MYSLDEVLELSPFIKRQGGTPLVEKCAGRIITAFSDKKKGFETRTCNCGQQTMYVMSEGARVCIHCDLVGHWPNFEKVLNYE